MRIGDPRLLPGVIFILVLSAILWKLSFKEQAEARNFSEELVPYHKALKTQTTKTLVSTFNHYSKNYNMKVLPEDKIALISDDK